MRGLSCVGAGVVVDPNSGRAIGEHLVEELFIDNSDLVSSSPCIRARTARAGTRGELFDFLAHHRHTYIPWSGSSQSNRQTR